MSPQKFIVIYKSHYVLYYSVALHYSTVTISEVVFHKHFDMHLLKTHGHVRVFH